MNEYSTEGVRYYRGNLPPEGVYADWVANGKEPPMCAVAAVGILAVWVVWLVVS